VVPAESLAPVPQGWKLEEMAAAPLTFLTAYQALTQWSDPPEPPPAGSVLLVTGASGGVGVATVLLGKSMGLFVTALSRSESKRKTLQQLGADLALDPADPNLKKHFKSAAPRPADIAVDNVAGPLFNQVIAMMGYKGRISVVGRSGGAVPDFNTGTLFFRRLRVGGVAVGDYTAQEAQDAWKQILARLAAMGRKPVVDRVFPFEQALAAFHRLAEGPMGKVLVQV
jgi:NADPH2:quinone reductase